MACIGQRHSVGQPREEHQEREQRRAETVFALSTSFQGIDRPKGDPRKIAVQHSTSSLWSAMAKAGFSTFALLREQDLGHHALVLVVQQMTMEY